jgi:arylsulfatase A-like enzyme
MRNLCFWLLPLLTFLLFGSNHCSAAAPGPNIILILTDDMGYGDVSCFGGSFLPTPNIDRLAKQGIRFTQFYVASPVCSPSRVGLLTGMQPARWRITNYLQSRAGNRASEQVDFLATNAPSLGRTLKQAGYVTAHFGKWHMGGGRDVTNAPVFQDYGFDEHASTWESPQPDPALTATNWVWSPHDRIKRWDRTAYFVDKTIDFLRRHKTQPCYINLWPDDVHTPWVPADSPPERKPGTDQSEASLKAVLAEYDRQVGRLLDSIATLGIDQNTIILFTSDNGPLPAFDGARTTGLRGSKISLYEGGTRMPFIARWLGHFPANQKDDQTIMSSLDLFPTLCVLAKVPLPTESTLDGQDMTQALYGKFVPRKAPLCWEYGRNNTAFNYPKGRDRSPNVAVRDHQWKLLVNADGSDTELYDLSKDRNETENVAAANPAIAERLKSEALRWRKSLP